MSRVRFFRHATAIAIGSCLLAAAARAEPAELVSKNAGSVAGNQGSNFSFLAKNGRYVFFSSYASNLAATDQDTESDIFLRDRATGTMAQIRVGDGGVDVEDDVHLFGVSGNGRYLGFYSYGDGIAPGVISNGSLLGYVHDRASQKTVLVTLDQAGQPQSESLYNISLSRNGKFVAFSTSAPYVVPNVATGDVLAYVHEVKTGETELVSVNANGQPATENCYRPEVSDDGRFVFFRTRSSNLDETVSDSNIDYDVYRRDRSADITRLVSLGHDGVIDDGTSEYAISATGRKLIFTNSGDVTGDGGVYLGVYVRNLGSGETRPVALATNGKAPGGASGGAIVADKKARCVAFVSYFTTIVASDPNGGTRDVFVADSKTGTLELISLDQFGGGTNDESKHPAISANGQFVSFASEATDLTATSNLAKQQVYLVER